MLVLLKMSNGKAAGVKTLLVIEENMLFFIE